MSVQEAMEFLRVNGLIIRSRCTSLTIPEILAICQAKQFLNSDEIDYCKNNYGNRTDAEKWDRISELLQKKQEITMEDVWVIFSGNSSVHILKYLKSLYTPSKFSNDINLHEPKGSGKFLKKEGNETPIKKKWHQGKGSEARNKNIFWNVPRGNQQFVGREEILNDISNSFQRRGNVDFSLITTCRGLGGIGKTTIAIKYAWMNRDKMNVFWFVADKPSKVIRQMFELEMDLDIDLKWFEENTNWLMIFDNAENMADITEFIPKNSGHILITSRNTQWEECYCIDIGIFTIKETRLLCNEILNYEFQDYEEVDKLGSELGQLPLALTIALFYIKRQYITISEYLINFREKKREMLQLEYKGLQVLPAVYTTWMITYEKMVKEDSHSAQFLVICAYYPDPDKIFWRQLKYFAFLKTNRFELYDQMRENLIKYSMVKAENTFFKIHRLVQQVLKLQCQKDEASNIFLYCRLRTSRHFNNQNFSIENFDEMYTILKRVDIRQQNVIFRLLSFMMLWPAGSERLRNYAQKNYVNISKIRDISLFETTLAYLGYQLFCKKHFHMHFSHDDEPSVSSIIKSYGKLEETKKHIYWEFFATLGDINIFSYDYTQRSMGIFESIIEILKPDFENPQVKCISQRFINHLWEYYKDNDIQRSIEFCKMEIGIIQELKGLDYDLGYICEIYSALGKAYDNIGNPKEAIIYYQIALETVENSFQSKHKTSFLQDAITEMTKKISEEEAFELAIFCKEIEDLK